MGKLIFLNILHSFKPTTLLSAYFMLYMKRLSCNQMGRDNLNGPANLILPSVEAVDPQIIDLLRRRHRASTVTCSVKRDTSESPSDMPPEPRRAPLNPNMAIITVRDGREQNRSSWRDVAKHGILMALKMANFQRTIYTKPRCR